MYFMCLHDLHIQVAHVALKYCYPSWVKYKCLWLGSTFSNSTLHTTDRKLTNRISHLDLGTPPPRHTNSSLLSWLSMMLMHSVFYTSRWPPFVFSISGPKCRGCLCLLKLWKQLIVPAQLLGTTVSYRMCVSVCVGLCVCVCWGNGWLWVRVKLVHYFLTPRSLSAGATLGLPMCVTLYNGDARSSGPPPHSSPHLISPLST